MGAGLAGEIVLMIEAVGGIRAGAKWCRRNCACGVDCAARDCASCADRAANNAGCNVTRPESGAAGFVDRIVATIAVPV